MYKHAWGTGHRSDLTRAEWRMYRYVAIKSLRGESAEMLDAPAWLKDEVRKFGREKWLVYFDRKTGTKKTENHTLKQSTAKPLRQGKGLFAISVREAREPKRPRTKQRYKKNST